MKLFLILLLTPAITFGYKLKDQDLTQYEYVRYVRPQLKSIIQDYKTLVILLNDDLKDFKANINSFRSLIDLSSSFENLCKTMESQNCSDSLKEIHKEFLNLIKIFDKQQILLSQQDIEVDKQIRAWHLLENVRLDVINSFFKIDSALVSNQLKAKNIISAKDIFHHVEKNYILFNLFLLENSHKDFKNPLHSYWISFIRPVYKYVLIRDNKEYFQNNLNELNFRWNELNVYLTKKNKNLPKRVTTLVNVMHNRWNNILKVTLKPIP